MNNCNFPTIGIYRQVNRIKMYISQNSTFAILLVSFLLMSTTSHASHLDLYEEDRDALEMFRHFAKDMTSLKEYQLTDSYLIKWLRANGLNAFHAAQKLEEAQAWREKNKMDAILNETIPMDPGYVLSKSSIDAKGNPVVALSIKNLDLQKLTLLGKKDEYFRYNFQLLEEMMTKARVISDGIGDGEEINQIYVIIDFDGYNKKRHACKTCLETMVEWYKDALKYYPGLRYREVWINTSPSSVPLVKVVRGMYSKLEYEDLKIFDTDKVKWSTFLLQDIASDQLPFQFGGTQFKYGTLTIDNS